MNAGNTKESHKTISMSRHSDRLKEAASAVGIKPGRTKLATIAAIKSGMGPESLAAVARAVGLPDGAERKLVLQRLREMSAIRGAMMADERPLERAAPSAPPEMPMADAPEPMTPAAFQPPNALAGSPGAVNALQQSPAEFDAVLRDIQALMSE